MNELLQELGKHIKNLRPEYYSALNQPLTDSEIDNLEKQFKIELPLDLQALYKWKNGQADNCYDAFVNNSMFSPLNQVFDTAQNLTSMIGFDFKIENWWNEKWLPIFHNGGGNYICYDLGGIFTGQQGQLIEFWNTDNSRNVIAPNLDTFIQTLINYFDTTPAADFNEFFSIKKNIPNYPQRFKVT